MREWLPGVAVVGVSACVCSGLRVWLVRVLDVESERLPGLLAVALVRPPEGANSMHV